MTCNFFQNAPGYTHATLRATALRIICHYQSESARAATLRIRLLRSSMVQIEKTTASFVIRIWLEDHHQGGSPDCWRGHITNVISRERRYVKSLAEITAFLSSHLENMGACPEE